MRNRALENTPPLFSTQQLACLYAVLWIDAIAVSNRTSLCRIGCVCSSVLSLLLGCQVVVRAYGLSGFKQCLCIDVYYIQVQLHSPTTIPFCQYSLKG